MQLALNDKRDSWARVIGSPGAGRARRSPLGTCSKRWLVCDHAQEAPAGGTEARPPDLGLVAGNTELGSGAVPEPTRRPRDAGQGCDGAGTSSGGGGLEPGGRPGGCVRLDGAALAVRPVLTGVHVATGWHMTLGRLLPPQVEGGWSPFLIVTRSLGEGSCLLTLR